LLLSVASVIVKLLARRLDVYSIAALLAFIMWIVDAMGLVPSAYSGYQWFVWGLVGLCLRRRQDDAVVVGSFPASGQKSRFENLLGAEARH